MCWSLIREPNVNLNVFYPIGDVRSSPSLSPATSKQFMTRLADPLCSSHISADNVYKAVKNNISQTYLSYIKTGGLPSHD